MYTVKQTRTFPPEFTVTGPDFSVTFNGVKAEALAVEYVAFKQPSQ